MRLPVQRCVGWAILLLASRCAAATVGLGSRVPSCNQRQDALVRRPALHMLYCATGVHLLTLSGQSEGRRQSGCDVRQT